MKHLNFNKLSSLVARVLAVLLMSGLAMTAQAQEDAEGNKGKSGTLMVGFKGGANLSEFIGGGLPFGYFASGAGSAKMLGGQFLGLLRYQANPWIAGDLELGWSMGSAKFVGEAGRFGQGSGAYTYNTHAFQANLLANVRLPIITVYKPKFFIGPSLNYNFYVNERYTGIRAIGSEVIKIDQSADATDFFEPVDFGAIVGLELEFDLKFAVLLVDARYRHGFSNVNNATMGNAAPALRGKRSLESAGVYLNAGLAFPLGGK
ncbi:MAG: outer membrane beta-barrel protein [Bernardetiaceae bacterium]